MANKTTSTSSEEVRSSVSSIYSQLLSKRKAEAEEKAAEHQKKEEEKKAEKEKDKDKDVIKMSKAERRQAAIDNWKEVVVDLTGDDLEYSDKKKKKKKYNKWIDDKDENKVVDAKKKKVKKKNYHKEFEPELNVLRTILTEQNKFTAELQKRFQNAAGPANKDAMPLNKTMVDLAAAIVSGRGNSLNVLKEIGGLKKAIADLTMKQKKLDSDLSGLGNSVGDSDLMLMGSSIMSGLDNPYMSNPQPQQQTQQMEQSMPPQQPVTYSNTYGYEEVKGVTPQVPQTYTPATSTGMSDFDPATWEGPELENDQVIYENIPKTIVVERSSSGDMRFKAVRNDNGEEIPGCPVPTIDPNTLPYNEKDNTVRGNFDETYKVVNA